MDFKALFNQMIAEERQKLEEATFAAKTVAERNAIQQREAFAPITRIIETIKGHVDGSWEFEVKTVSAKITFNAKHPKDRHLQRRPLGDNPKPFTAVLKVLLDQEGFVCKVASALHPSLVDNEENVFESGDEAAEFITRFVARMIAQNELGAF